MTNFDKADLMTAIITPFNKEGEVDYPGLKRLTEHLLKKWGKFPALIWLW